MAHFSLYEMNGKILPSLIAILLAAEAFLFTPYARSQDTTGYYKRVYETRRIQSAPPRIDGKYNDACWDEVTWSQWYVQHMPVEGGTPSEKTRLKVLYDNRNIYVFIRAYEKDPSRIRRFICQRDALFEGGDIVGINFDSYNDHKTGFEFDVTAGGTQVDLLLNNVNYMNPDFNWNAVWYSGVSVDDSGWCAEMRIPLSQLRYSSDSVQVWGMHAWRWISRNMEEDQWSLIPRNTNAFIHSFGQLHGIRDLPKNRRLEIMPYTLGSLRTNKHEEGNPFTGSIWRGTFGADGRVGIRSNFTFDYTFNPDFGQVEADPSVMNLTAFETFYEEKRPFFLEGKNILSFDTGSDEDLVFYSRRIGSAPPYAAPSDSAIFTETPGNTSILDALKISGKTANGLSLGILQSFTPPEYSSIYTNERYIHRMASPPTNYFVGRVQKDFHKGNTSIGGILTSVNRFFSQEHLNFLSKQAYTGGLDFIHYWKEREYFITANFVGSYISGSQEAILRLQRSSARYFQRPDANHLAVDSSLSVISGTGGLIGIGKEGNSKLIAGQKIFWRSPGLDLNDIGYMREADVIGSQSMVGYRETKPGKILRSYSVVFSLDYNWDFAGVPVKGRSELETQFVFNNKWTGQVHLNRFFSARDNRLLRGGYALRTDPYHLIFATLQTDDSRNLSFNLQYNSAWYSDGFSYLQRFAPGIKIRFSSQFSITSQINYEQNQDALQYVTSFGTEQQPIAILGALKQKTLGITIRTGFYFTPDFSLQYYGSPFISTGRYVAFRVVTDPLNESFDQRFYLFRDTETTLADGNYTLTRGSTSYSFPNPDFTMLEFRSNFVARWEYKPGSVFYFVWTHQRNDYRNIFHPAMDDNMDSLFGLYPENMFLIKLNYYFSL